jgi:hypothetical protein
VVAREAPCTPAKRLELRRGDPVAAARRCAPMPKVESQALDRVEYDSPSRTLFVRFTSGEWSAYLDVAPATCARMAAAPSKGRFFQDQIRDRYAYRRLDLSPAPPSSGHAGQEP